MKMSKLIPAILCVPVLISVELMTGQVGRTATDGCGSGPTGRFTPNNPTGASFEAACNNHDTCYETPGQTKEYCDNQFYNEMVSACSTEYGTGLRFKACKKVAGGYYKAVKRYGQSAYDSSQGTR